MYTTLFIARVPREVIAILYTVIPGYYNPFLGGGTVRFLFLVRRSIDNVIILVVLHTHRDTGEHNEVASVAAAYQLTVGIKYYTGRGSEKFDNLPTL